MYSIVAFLCIFEIVDVRATIKINCSLEEDAVHYCINTHVSEENHTKYDLNFKEMNDYTCW